METCGTWSQNQLDCLWPDFILVDR